MAEGEQRRGLADGARPEAGAGAPLRAEVEGRAEHGDVGVDPVPVELKRILAEGRNADEGQIEPALLVGVRHGATPPPVFARFAAMTQRSSNITVAPTSAVMPPRSKGGDTSTTSAPTMSSPREQRGASACASRVVMPPISGVPVPGAMDGSMHVDVEARRRSGLAADDRARLGDHARRRRGARTPR